MTKLQNFQINTHFTALKQLPEVYHGQFTVPAQQLPSLTIARDLGSAIIDVPAGVYVEIPLLRTSFDDDINHLAHWLFLTEQDEEVMIYISLNQVKNNQYELRANASNFGSSNYSLKQFTVEAYLRLAIAPFSV